MASPAVNKEKINENRRKIFLLEHAVYNNKASAYLTRDSVLENRALIQKNYEATFQGNRQLANANTEAIFRNRIALIKSLNAEDPVKINFREAVLNSTKLDFLDHRSKLNSYMNARSEELAAINARLIEINAEIIAANAEIVKYNHDQIAGNKQIIEKGVDGWTSATSEKNAALIATNAERIAEISGRVDTNAKKNASNYEQTKSNYAKIEQNAAYIHERRAEIETNRAAIQENANKIATMIQ